MGNFFLLFKDNSISELNFIVAFYLFKMSWKDINNFLNKRYCQKLINLVSKLLIKYYDIKDSFLLSKQFIKIGHIYATILVNTNPILIYNTNKKIMISKIKGKVDKNKLLLEPNCSFKIPLLELINSQLKDLDDIYNDKFTNNDKKYFDGQSELLKKKYINDQELFFNSLIPNDKFKINKDFTFENNFEEAKKDLLNININNEENEIYEKFSSVTLSNYGQMIRVFLVLNNENQNELINYLTSIFKVKLNDLKNKEEICVNYLLSNNDLDQIVYSIRGIVLNMNLQCNEFYDKLFSSYEAIVESLILSISKLQIESLEKKLEDISIINQ
jgi:hypothetical protein